MVKILLFIAVIGTIVLVLQDAFGKKGRIHTLKVVEKTTDHLTFTLAMKKSCSTRRICV